jgi:hypothetical protein
MCSESIPELYFIWGIPKTLEEDIKMSKMNFKSILALMLVICVAFAMVTGCSNASDAEAIVTDEDVAADEEVAVDEDATADEEVVVVDEDATADEEVVVVDEDATADEEVVVDEDATDEVTE